MSFSSVAVLIPAYEMPKELGQTLACLQAQVDTPAFQTVIVDDSASDDVERVVDWYSYKYGMDIKYIRRRPEPGFRVASAWNILWPSADVGPDGILILTNSHILMGPRWVANHVEYHQRNGTVGVIGPYHEGGWDKPSSIGQWDDAGREHIKFTLLRCYSDSVRKKHIENIGGWDERFDGWWGWEDVDLAYRLQNNGVQWVRGERVEVVHITHPERRGVDRGKRNGELFFEKYPELRGVVG